jgi:Ala-tRNA(Pro) deacylase
MELQTYLKRQGVDFELHEHETAFTAQQVAQEEHVSGDMVAKSVLVRCGDKQCLCVLQASHKIDLNLLAQTLQCDRCELADENEIARLFPDVEVGAEPPFGKMYNLETVVDEDLTGCRWITFQAGTHRQAIRMRYEDYARLAQPKVVKFSLHL